MNTPDIEIYAKDLSAKMLLEWLAQHFEHVSLQNDPAEFATAFKSKDCINAELSTHANKVELVITPRAAGKSFCSLWFKSAETPWQNDEACALSLLDMHDIEVRCSASGWQEGEDEMSEQWLLLTREEKKLIRWG